HTNLALFKATSQIDSCWSGDSYKAVDGSWNSDHFGSSACTHTCDNTNDPWWQVDLGQVYSIQKIIIKNRSDGSTEPGRFRNVTMYASYNPQWSLSTTITMCGHFTGPGTHGQVIEMNCNSGTIGRYIILQKKSGVLTMCEVEVYERQTVSWNRDIGVGERKNTITTLSTIYVRSLKQCMHQCLVTVGCNSVNARTVNGLITCEIKFGTSEYARLNQVSDPAWDHLYT
ncbi:hypothetical protein KUTeg_016977, partial [Tegillarca granosa]